MSSMRRTIGRAIGRANYVAPVTKKRSKPAATPKVSIMQKMKNYLTKVSIMQKMKNYLTKK